MSCFNAKRQIHFIQLNRGNNLDDPSKLRRFFVRSPKTDPKYCKKYSQIFHLGVLKSIPFLPIKGHWQPKFLLCNLKVLNRLRINMVLIPCQSLLLKSYSYQDRINHMAETAYAAGPRFWPFWGPRTGAFSKNK